MNPAPAWAAFQVAPNIGGARWHRRVVRRVDLTGAVVLIMPALLGLHLMTESMLVGFAMYGACLLLAVPNAGPFMGSLRQHPANLQLAALFVVLSIATAGAFARVSMPLAILQTKTLLATAVWISIFLVVFSAIRKVDDATRLVRTIERACLFITASVYLSAVGHAAGIRFGEVLEFSDGHIRAFGPLGDQVGFVLVLPALMALVASRPVMFGVHVGALLLTATRGAILCLAVGIVIHVAVILTAKGQRGRNRVIGGLATLAVAALLWLSPMSNVALNRVQQPLDSADYGLRLAAMEAGIQLFLDNPVLGVGFNGYGAGRRAVAEDWLHPWAAENGLSRAANQYVQTATDGGVAALLLLVLFVLCTSRNAFSVARSRAGGPELAGTQIWLVAIFAGNHGALWLLSNTATGFFMFAVAGLTASMTALAHARTAGVTAAPQQRA